MTNFNKENNNNIKLSNKELTKISNDIIKIVLRSENDNETEYNIIEKIKEIILLNHNTEHIENMKKEILQSHNKEEINPINNINANTQKPLKKYHSKSL